VDRSGGCKPVLRDVPSLLDRQRTYFGKYALLVARRYAQTNPANGLHVHCVGFDPREAISSWGL
jgi:hypothetical protein